MLLVSFHFFLSSRGVDKTSILQVQSKLWPRILYRQRPHESRSLQSPRARIPRDFPFPDRQTLAILSSDHFTISQWKCHKTWRYLIGIWFHSCPLACIKRSLVVYLSSGISRTNLGMSSTVTFLVLLSLPVSSSALKCNVESKPLECNANYCIDARFNGKVSVFRDSVSDTSLL